MSKLGYDKRPLAEPDEQMTKKFESMLVEWFYSGDWTEVREGEESWYRQVHKGNRSQYYIF